MTPSIIRLLMMIAGSVLLVACGEREAEPGPPLEPEVQAVVEQPDPPMAEQRDHVVKAPAGERNDPWYWLRDDSRGDPEVLAYLEAENDYLQARMAHTEDLQSELFSEMRSRIVEDDSTVPFPYRGYYYYIRFEDDREYPIHARRKGSPDGEEEILLDVNELAADHAFYQVGNWDVTPDGRWFAWLEDTVGQRQFRIRILNTESGEMMDPDIGGVSSLAWGADGRHLFYVENDPDTLRSFRVRRFAPGQDEAPVTVYEEDDTAFYTFIGRSKSDEYMIIFHYSTASTELRILPTAEPEGEFRVFLPRQRDHQYYAEHIGDQWIIRSNYQAPNFALMSAPVDGHDDMANWSTVVAHDNSVFIQGFDTFTDFIAISERSNGLRRIRILNRDGSGEEMLTFDEPAYTASLAVNREQETELLRFSYSSLTTPTSVYQIDMRTGERELLKRDEVPGDFDPDHYRSDRLWVEARDGTKVPVSLLYHRDTALDGTAPLYLFGYGAYGASMDPFFATGRLSLVDRGFVFAIAHIRGGQEMGREWYEQGRLTNKKNTFTDFIDVTRYLVDQGMVDGERVFAVGGSAGGLLVGAVANMAPELYRGIVAHVPFVDVVTTMLDESIPLTTNEFDEWGNPVEPEFYEYMLAYSPYDNVSEQDYPAMLVTAGLWDSQVQYWEPAKWVARMRANKTDGNPLLLLTHMEAGHGGQSGRFRRMEQTALEYAFILDLAEH